MLLLNPHRTIGSLWLALLIVFTTSCSGLKFTQCEGPADGGEADCQATSLSINNPRIEIVDQASLHPGSSYWVRAGEGLQAKWDSYSYFYSLSEVTCDFAQLTEATDDCSICNLCLTGAAYDSLCYFDFVALTEADGLRLTPKEGFMDPPQETIFLVGPSGCGARGFSPFTFTPSVNTAYELRNPQHFPDQVLSSKKVFVIGGATKTQTAVYPLMSYAEPHPDIVWFKWAVMGDPVWEDNFSKNVRITGIQILNGSSLISDPNSGRMMVANAQPVRASRVVLIPLFDPSVSVLSQDAYYCYSNPSGQINLTNCVATYGDTSGPLLDAVPTYMKSLPGDMLTWIVEFNPDEDADPVPATGVMAIEFTIEAVQ